MIPSAEQLTAIAAIIAAIGAIMTSVLGLISRPRIKATHETSENTAAAVTMSDGQTIALAVEGIAAATPGSGSSHPADKPPIAPPDPPG